MPTTGSWDADVRHVPRLVHEGRADIFFDDLFEILLDLVAVDRKTLVQVVLGRKKRFHPRLEPRP